MCFTYAKTPISCLFILVCSYCPFSFPSFLCLLTCILLVLFIQISSARDDNDLAKSLSEEADFLFECDISKIRWLFTEREQLKLLLCKYNVIYCAKASLDQFAEGLQSVGLLPYIKQNVSVLREVFCHAPAQLTCASFRNLLSINFTVPGSNTSNELREGEEATILCWEEYLDKLERSHKEGLL